MGGTRGAIKGIPSFESVIGKAFLDNKFRVGVSDMGNGTFRLVTTNAKTLMGENIEVKTFFGSSSSVTAMAKALKSGKSYTEAYNEALKS